MTISQEVESILENSVPFLSKEDVRWAKEFIAHKEYELTIEFLCDKFYGYNKAIPDKIGCRIQDICEMMKLSQDRTWDSIIVKNDTYEQKIFRLYYLHSEREEVKATVKKLVENVTYIFNEVKKMFDKNRFHWEEEYLIYDEWTLVMEGICSALSESKKPISKDLYDLIASVLETLLIDKKLLDKIVVLSQEHKENE
jgi:hypothetical protein